MSSARLLSLLQTRRDWSGAELPPLLLDDEEAVAVAVGLRTAAGGGVDGVGESALRALVKLEQRTFRVDRMRPRIPVGPRVRAVRPRRADRPGAAAGSTSGPTRPSAFLLAALEIDFEVESSTALPKALLQVATRFRGAINGLVETPFSDSEMARGNVTRNSLRVNYLGNKTA